VFKVITVWSPGGHNTADFSYGISLEFSQYTKVILVELPCLGVPRLGFVTNIFDRQNHTEAAILELEKKGELSFTYIHEIGKSLSVLPSCAFAMPDFPLTHKVELETLTLFPGHFINKARRQGYGVVVFECQGQLTSPMTFFAVKKADIVLIPVYEPSDIAFSLINIKRLIQIFKFEPVRFKAVSQENAEVLTEIMVIKDDDDREISRIEVLPANISQITSNIFYQDAECRPVFSRKKECKTKNILNRLLKCKIFKSNKKAACRDLAVDTKINNSAGEEVLKIKL